jgi:exosortase
MPVTAGRARISPGEALLGFAPGLIALAWLVSKLRWVWNSQPEMQFGWIVLMLSAFLVWDNWERRPVAVLQPTLLNTLVAVAGLVELGLVQVYQAAFGTNAASLCGHAVGVLLIAGANLHLLLGAAGLWTFGFPLVFLLVALPLPSVIQGPLTGGLQGLVASVNVEVLNLAGVPAERTGSLIRLPGGTVGVNEACSGIRSLQSSIMATLFIGYLSLRSNFLRALLFVGGIATAVFGNILRSLYLSFTAQNRGVAAVDEVHDAAGWSILVFTAVGVGLLAWFLSGVEKRSDTAAAEEDPRSGATPTPVSNPAPR